MRMKKKRITAMLMSALFAASAAAEALPPMKVFAAEGDVTVRMADIGVPLFNAANYNNSAFKEEFLYKNGAELNPGYKFGVKETNNMKNSVPDNLSDAFSTTFTKKNNDSWWYASYIWRFAYDSSPGAFRDLINKGDIKYEMSGKLSYDSHTNAKNHWTTKKDRATLTMYQNAKEQKQYKSSTDGAEKTLNTNYGRGTWLTPLSGGGNFQVVMYHDTCSCGTSGAKHVAVGFADTVPARVTNVTTTGGQSYYSEGYVDIVITFDENIRFADGGTSGKKADSSNELVLSAYNRQTGQYLDGGVTAQLISLDGNRLTYRYTVPDNETTDIVLTGIAGVGDQTMFGNKHDLYLYTANGQYKDLYTDAQFENLSTINSPFTDLAGNSIADGWSATPFNGNSVIYIDTIPPEYSVTDVSGSMMKGEAAATDQDSWPADIDRSQVFAGPGDTLTFSSTFNEEINVADPTAVTAVLNIKNGSGGNVTVRGAEVRGGEHRRQQ